MPLGEDVTIIASSIHHYKYEVELAKKIKKKYPNTKIGLLVHFHLSCLNISVFLILLFQEGRANI